MTREEKINTLKAVIQECEEYQWQRRETLFEIIKDLEQQPCETQKIDKSNFSQEQYKADLQSAYDCGKASVKPCEDAISRADAVRVASGYCHPANIAKELAKLPSVTPIRPKGHWINKSEQDAVTLKIYECSECGKFVYRDFDYCPNCGSDNRVRDKE